MFIDVDREENRPELVALICIYRWSCRESNSPSEIALSCGNAESGYAKRRDSTRNDLRIRERC
jgi:hypothetical protein